MRKPSPTAASPVEPSVLTTREAGSRLGVSVRTVQLWVESGVLDAWKTPGGHRRVSSASVRTLLEARGPSVEPTRTGLEPVVLVVEDNEPLRRLYEKTLLSWKLPITVLTAPDGFAGLIALGSHHPRVIITDLDMPYIDGFQMLRVLARRPDCADTTLIAVSGLSPLDVQLRGGLPDGVRFYSKPVRFSTLRKGVESALALPEHDVSEAGQG